LMEAMIRKGRELYYPKKVGNRLTNLFCLILVLIVWAHVIYAGRAINARVVDSSSKFKSNVDFEAEKAEEESLL